MIFLFIFLFIVVFMNYIIYINAIKIQTYKQFYKSIFSSILVFVVLIEFSFVGFFAGFSMPKWYYLLCISLFGVSFMLFCVSLVYAVFFIGIKYSRFNMQRRKAILKMLNIFFILASISYVLKGFIGGMKKPFIKSLHVKLDKLKKPLKIVQITDVHIGRFLKGNFLKQIVEQINALNPDIVAITGDLVDYKLEFIKNDLKPLMDIKSKYGTFFVPGNHEYYHGVEEILEYLTSLHVKVLKNENVQVGGINICGLYDIGAYKYNHPLKPNLAHALLDVDENLPTILLAHQPKQINEITDENIDLMLSGHTHAGQIFPFGLLVKLDQPYVYGLHQHNEKTKIYVSSGCGYWGPPIRMFAPSEIVNINLMPKNV